MCSDPLHRMQHMVYFSQTAPSVRKPYPSFCELLRHVSIIVVYKSAQNISSLHHSLSWLLMC